MDTSNSGFLCPGGTTTPAHFHMSGPCPTEWEDIQVAPKDICETQLGRAVDTFLYVHVSGCVPMFIALCLLVCLALFRITSHGQAL